MIPGCRYSDSCKRSDGLGSTTLDRYLFLAPRLAIPALAALHDSSLSRDDRVDPLFFLDIRAGRMISSVRGSSMSRREEHDLLRAVGSRMGRLGDRALHD